MDMLGFDYFKLLDMLTIARSRKHVQRYYGTAETCLLYTSDAADDLLCVALGGRRIIKKKSNILPEGVSSESSNNYKAETRG